MNYERCETCGKFGDMERHKCHPQWEVACLEYDETYWPTFYAYDAESAATQFAESYDHDEYDSLDGGEIVVRVRKKGETETMRFICYGEAEPAYYANVVE